MNVSNIGEFPLIERLLERLGASAAGDLVVGPGDDAAVWRSGDSFTIGTTDTLVEGVHVLHGVPWVDVGWKALAVNVSDVAAMGGEPQFALVTLCLPPAFNVSDLDALYDGLAECAREYGVTITGGDIVRASEFSITLALLGRALVRDGEPLLLRRDGARAGNSIGVTGTLGASGAGLRRLRESAPNDDPLVRAHLRPRPPVAAGQAAARLGLRCAIDVSDGLLQDIGHICERSRLRATIHADAIPIDPHARRAYPDDGLTLGCVGGEDYQLVLAGPQSLLDQLSADHSLTVIGELSSGEPSVRLLDVTGREVPVGAGWDHLRSTAAPA